MGNTDFMQESNRINQIMEANNIDPKTKLNQLKKLKSTYKASLERNLKLLKTLADKQAGQLDKQIELKNRLMAMRKQATKTKWKKTIALVGFAMGMIAMGIVTVLVAIGTAGAALLSALGLSVPLTAAFQYLTSCIDIDDNKIQTNISEIEKEINAAKDDSGKIKSEITLAESNEQTCKKLLTMCGLNIAVIQMKDAVTTIEEKFTRLVKDVSALKRSNLTPDDVIKGSEVFTNSMKQFEQEYNSKDNKEDMLMEATNKLIVNVEKIESLTDKDTVDALKELRNELNLPLPTQDSWLSSYSPTKSHMQDL